MSENDTMFNERDLRFAAVQILLSTDPSYDNRTIASTLKMQIRTVQLAQGDENKVSGKGYGPWCGFKWAPHHATSKVGLKVNTKVYLDVLKSVVNPWCNQVASDRPWVWLHDSAPVPQVQRDPGLASEGVLRLCTLLSLAPLLPRAEPAGLLRLVILQEHHQHDLPQHQSQPDRLHPPIIRRAPAGACGKDMLPVPDPYRGGDWGWRRLHWIDVSSTT